MPKIQPVPLARTLDEIARDIHTGFKNSAGYYAAEPYVDALYGLHQTDLSGHYYEDTVATVVLYLVENLGGWRGDKAREVKAELRSALAYHQKKGA